MPGVALAPSEISNRRKYGSRSAIYPSTLSNPPWKTILDPLCVKSAQLVGRTLRGSGRTAKYASMATTRCYAFSASSA